MPHKHTRKTADATDFNLPPTTVAKPLSAYNKPIDKNKKRKHDQTRASSAKKQKVTSGYGADDTPRAFARMMQMQAGKKLRSGLDDGHTPKPAVKAAPELVRLPGETLRDFSARVDQSLPLSNLVSKGNKVEGMKERQTKKEKKMHKMYAEWRAEDAKIKARQEEEQEKAEEEADERTAEFGDIKLPESRRAKKRRAIGEVGGMDDDPWAVLKTRREAPRGLHDVAQAPPELVVPTAKFRVANVPQSSGSLKKREELSEARQEVIERYRAMMGRKI